MCHTLSVCVTKDDAEVIAHPGVHHHSDLVRQFWSKGRIPARGEDLIGLEMNVRTRTLVLDEHAMPPWYKGRHDDAVWEWLQGHVWDKDQYREWLARELAAGIRGLDVRFSLAPLGFDSAPGFHPEHRWKADSPEEALDRFRAVVEQAEAYGPDSAWVPRWEADPDGDGLWSVSFDHSDLSTEARVVPAEEARPVPPVVNQVLSGYGHERDLGGLTVGGNLLSVSP